jgi:hypothetical protein
MSGQGYLQPLLASGVSQIRGGGGTLARVVTQVSVRLGPPIAADIGLYHPPPNNRKNAISRSDLPPKSTHLPQNRPRLPRNRSLAEERHPPPTKTDHAWLHLINVMTWQCKTQFMVCGPPLLDQRHVIQKPTYVRLSPAHGLREV